MTTKNSFKDSDEGEFEVSVCHGVNDGIESGVEVACSKTASVSKLKGESEKRFDLNKNF